MDLLVLVAYGFGIAVGASFCLIAAVAVYRAVRGRSESAAELYIGLGFGLMGLAVFWMLGLF